MKRAIVAAAVVLVAGAALYFYLHHRKPPAVRFETAKVARGNITARVTATGTLSALVTVQVGTQVSGRIAQLYVDFNSPVKKGQLIAKIDPQLFEAAVEQAQANVAAGRRATSRKAKAQRQRTPSGSSSAQQAAARRRSWSRRPTSTPPRPTPTPPRASVDRARGRSSAQARGAAPPGRGQPRLHDDRLAHRRRRSSRATSTSGQTVAASLQAPTLFTIAAGPDARCRSTPASPRPTSAGSSRGMAATFTVDAYPGERFRGTVRQIRNAPQTVQNVVTYDAVIDVDNADLQAQAGHDRERHLRLRGEATTCSQVPNAALRFRPPPEMLPPPAAPSACEGRQGSGGRRGAGERRRGGAGSGGQASRAPAAPARPAPRSGCCATSSRVPVTDQDRRHRRQRHRGRRGRRSTRATR